LSGNALRLRDGKYSFVSASCYFPSGSPQFESKLTIREQAVLHSAHQNLTIQGCVFYFFAFNRSVMMENILRAGLAAVFHREDGIFNKTKTRSTVVDFIFKADLT
jgi:hypothetical protein